ncbi:MAG TPA: VCBS repeat-containing protein, partial [Acidobacteriaceae bacterium]|nr:VCBS repeat-containing protein [Acidobacteriaceae bacterium]
MDRRTFGKLVAGTVTAAGIHGTTMAANQTNAQKSPLPDLPPSGGSDSWEYTVLDAAPAHATETGATAAADIDGDGKTEVIIGSNGALLWYRPSTSERGVVSRGYFNVGIALEDVDRDGHKEVIIGKNIDGKWALCWYKFGTNLHDEWTEHILDGQTTGHPHDVVFGDVDGDGERELVANAMYSDTPGLFTYKIPRDATKPWKKQAVQSGLSAEGTATGDLDGDGKDEIVSGPYWFSAPSGGAFSGELWKTHSLAPDYREYCRAAVIDVNGDGRPDVILVEDEYPDGRLAWFENRLHQGLETPFTEHPIEAPLNFCHTLRAWHDAKTKQVQILACEMNEGGWEAPYNWTARLILYTPLEKGKFWHSEILYRGEGTHEAVYTDLDGSGTPAIFGHSAQILTKQNRVYTGWVQMFRPRTTAPVFSQYKHTFVDRQKPYTGIDIHAADVDGDGKVDIVCGAWWYKNPGWERHTIPGIGQIIAAYDVDKDGRNELIGIKAKPGKNDFYNALTSELVWLKPTDLGRDVWEEHVIGTGDGDWPHGVTIAPLLPGGRAAMVCGYHDGKNPPQLFEVPDDPKQPWPKHVIADIHYGEQMIPYDLDGDGKLDIVAGPYWLENLGDGQFRPHLLIDPDLLQSANLKAICRIAIADINGNGRPDILFTVENVDWDVHKAFFSPVGWLENTGSPRDRKFNLHIIDKVRSPHSISVADLDGDGKMEVVVGEHDPFKPYRSESRLLVYKQADAQGISWSRFPVDNRFEHHDGAKIIELIP